MKLVNQSTKILSIIFLIALFNCYRLSITQAAPPWEQTHKLLTSDGAKLDKFGYSVSLNGDLAVIGAPIGDSDGLDTGSAYVFDVTSGQQLFKLQPTDVATHDYFGFSVALGKNYAVIGAYGDDNENNYNSGSAYVFDIITGQQLFKLRPSDSASGDEFGFSVAISGNLAIIGALDDDDNGENSGAVYVFDVTTGQQIFKLMATDGDAGDFFGNSVALNGNVAIIGATGDTDNGSYSGSAYVFDVATDRQLFKLLPTDGASMDNFGTSVSLSGNLAVIGALGNDDNGGNSGSAYVFDVTTGRQLFKLLPNDGTIDDRFGKSCAISGNLTLVSANGDDDKGLDFGSAYIFDLSTGQQLYKLLPSDGSRFDDFGNSVAIKGNLAVMGAIYADNGNNYRTGAAYIFQQRITNYLTVEPFPLHADQDGIFSIFEGVPDDNTWILYSLKGLGQTFISQLNVTIDLNKPVIAAGPRLTDANGDLQLLLQLPTIVNPRSIWFQAVQKNNTTNFFRSQIIP